MSDNYFKKWKELLRDLDKHVKVDLDYQETKVHDKTCCEAAQRLGGVLVKYMAFYNDSMDCLQQNLQVQKTTYIEDVTNAVAARIMELINQLRKLESHRYQFVGNGLIQSLLTFDNSEPRDLLRKIKRSARMQTVIDEVILRANARMEATLHGESTEENTSVTENKQIINVWESDEESEEDNDEIEKKLSEESLKRIEMLKIIQAHERSRQIVRWATQRQFKRTMWEKELNGTLKPQAKLEVKERAAKLIQNVLRSYFRIKRQRIDQCKADKLLGISLCEQFVPTEKIKGEQIVQQHTEKYKQYVDDWKTNCEQMKEAYTRKVKDDLTEEYRDVIRNWFRKWYDEVRFFYNIPNDDQGGSTLIITEEVPSPSEWQEQYEAYLEEKKANKNKTSLQKKYEKQEAKREEMQLKREEKRKLKLEETLLKKIMKNPKMHPGFHYPVSKKTNQIINVIENYQEDWKQIDIWEVEGYKEGFVKEVDKGNACMNVKMEIMTSVDESMRQELKILKKALQTDYKNNNEKMPETMKTKKEAPKTETQTEIDYNGECSRQIGGKELVVTGVLKERIETKFDKFLGEYNYGGDDLRCVLQTPQPLGGEIKCMWWEKCNEFFHGAQRFLLVGPHGCGKATLVRILASVNDATLFVLDPLNFPEDLKTSAGLRQVVNSVVTCSRAVQPSVIHVKALELLYCKKAPPGEDKKKLDMYRKFFIQTLLKKIRKDDIITVIGSCCDPWSTASKKMLKNFPDVILLPDATYPTVSMILRNWMTENRIVPRDLNLQSVAQMLRGYPFGYLKESLNSFLTPENIIKIAAHGLSPQELYEHVTRGGTEERIDYEKYQQWYKENTAWGKKEEKRVQDDKEFNLIKQKYAEKERKNKPQHTNTSEDDQADYESDVSEI